MRALLRSRPAVALTLAQTRHVLLGLFFAIGGLYVGQARQLLKYANSEGQTAGAIAEAMQSRFNGMSLALMSYLQTHDSLSLDRIRADGRQASELLGQLKSEAAKRGSGDAYRHVEKAHEDMRQATMALLEADRAELKSREALNASGETLLSIMIARMEPSIKPNQLQSSARLESVLAAAAEAKSLTRTPVDEQTLRASQKRFRAAIGKYAALSQTTRAQRWADEALDLFAQTTALARDNATKSAQKQTALERYTDRRNVFDLVLQESRPFRKDSAQPFSIKQALSSDMALVGMGGLLLVFSVAFVFLAWPRGQSAAAIPLEDILQCAEAAAAGDTSRLPQPVDHMEAARLGRAVGRLISVLGRSENLVYHLAALVESSGDAIVSFNLEGTILSWNKGAQMIYGYSADEMKGQPMSILAPEDNGIEMLRALQRVRKGERIQPFETVHRARNGRTIRALVRMSAIQGSTRQVIGASFCAQDLTATELLRSRSIDTPQIPS